MSQGTSMGRRPKTRRVGDHRAQIVRGPHKDGSGRWYWRVRAWVDGEDATVATTWATTDEIEDLLASLHLQRGKRERMTVGSLTTVRDLLSRWVGTKVREAEEGRLSRNTAHNYKHAAGQWTKRVGELELRRVGLVVMEGHLEDRMAAGAAPLTIRNELQVLRRAWRWARKRGLLFDAEPPMPDLKAETTREKRTPTAGDVRAVLKHLPHAQALIVRVLWGTGLRIRELGELRVEDVDQDVWVLTVGIHPGAKKTGRREVPVIGDARAALVEALDLGPFQGRRVFPGASGIQGKVNQALAKACEAAKVRRFTSHGLRRAVVDRLYRSGVEIAAAADLLGHSPKTAMLEYRRATADDRAQAARAAGLGSLGGEVVDLDEARRSR